MKINIFGIIWNIVKMMFKLLSFVIVPLFVIFLFILFSFIYYCFYFRVIKKIKPKKSDVKRTKDVGVLKKIFVQFPRQLAYDYLTQDPDSFGEFGIHMICGCQGAGKTITCVYLLRKWQKKYPKLEIYTNMAYRYENGEINHWRELISRNNGIYGVVNVLDEIHTWFSNKESKDLPPEVLGEISQQRKQKKAIIGTAQVFSKIAKPLREQTHFVYIPRTFLGCLTIVFKANSKDYDAEKDSFKKYTGFFFFVHTKELREAYDTYKRISRYVDTEFAPSIYSGNPPAVAEVPDK